MELHVPTDLSVKAMASVVGYTTDGLDAVVLRHEVSTKHAGSVHLVLTGNARDLEIARQRAEKLGGVTD